MMIEIDNKTIRKVTKPYVQQLISLIEKREYILRMFCLIQLDINMRKRQDEYNQEQIVKQQIENFEIEEDITNEEKNQFINIFRQLNEHDCGEL